jgi:Domain of unknown function (DUF4389)
MTAPSDQQAASQSYPLTFSVDYPERLSRLTTFFRLLLAIPIVLLMYFLVGYEPSFTFKVTYEDVPIGIPDITAIGGLLFLAPLLMLLFRKKYPRWWFDWNLALLRFQNRLSVYLGLLRDEYPSTDEDQAVHLDMRYPDAATELNRWLPLVKWLLAIPHYVILVFLSLATMVVMVIAWFAILITGRYPRGLFDFVVGYLRWTNRVTAYAFILTTDRYPPFRLGP